MPQTNKISKVIAKAWKDPAFKKKLLTDPKAALKEMGVTFPEGVTVRVMEDSSKTFTLVLPAAPTQIKEMSDSDLERIAGGLGSGMPGCDASASEGPNCPHSNSTYAL